MSQVLFIFFLLFVSILRVPLSLLVIVLKPLIPFLNKRVNFERQNFLHESSLSFRRESMVADFCFEVSSEGELEQIRPLLESILVKGKKTEILFSSPSVEKKCLDFFHRFPHQVRLLRLPLLTFWPIQFLYFQNIWSWVSAPVIVFCRYDFFPELLLLKLFRKKFVLLSGAVKKRGFYKLLAFRFFDIVVAATDHEKNQFQDLLNNEAELFSCDFRIPGISERFFKAQETLEKKASLSSYVHFLNGLKPSEKMILGSVWESDLLILKDAALIEDVKNRQMNLLIVPHKLDESFVLGLHTELKALFGDESVEVLKDGESFKGAPVVILQMSGLLCELYSLFSTSYVGGGYERSIHSVLEPFFSDSFVIVGPKTHRSTEYDLALEVAPAEIHVLIHAESFYTTCKKDFLNKTPNKEVRALWREHAKAQMKRISELLLAMKKLS